MHDAFSRFFQAAWGHEPFPWQRRLADQVLAEGWPAQLDLPTGAGKTSAIDVAVFALTRRADLPRRVVFVVDRRVVVDQAHHHAVELAKKLREARQGPLAEAAEALRRMARLDEAAGPLDVAILRGGMPRDDDWARLPHQPLVVVSTVDQVGSRLLFRGYGVSSRMASVHAGLLGVDTLLLLDEVHLSKPFADTLEALEAHRATPLPRRHHVVHLSATPGRPSAHPFRLDDEDRAHPVLAQRLRASKRARLDTVKRRADLPEACAAHARRLLQAGARVVGVVVNRVATARDVARTLGDTPSVLLTGRMRPLDRDAIVAEVLPRIGPRRERSADEAPLVVVATQCIEAGADLDLDALVTECASADALRQRFGRVDRRGHLGLSESVILGVEAELKENDDPVYGAALPKSWTWLQGLDHLDLGIEACPAPPEDTLAPPKDAPRLLPSHVALWACTHPLPHPDPAVSLWLHGAQRGVPEVHVVWRADLTEADLEDTPAEELVARLAACPPASAEALAVPLPAIRAWLEGAEEPTMADVEGEAVPEPADRRRVKEHRLALRWDGEESELVGPDALRPGATLVVPATRGGLWRGTWDPGAREPVSDLGDEAQEKVRGRATRRLHPAVHPELPQPPVPGDGDDADTEALEAWLDANAEALNGWTAARGVRRIALPGHAWVLVAREAKRDADVSTADEGSSHTGRPISLAQHLGDVERHARHHAEACGLPPELVRDLALAGRLHDLGKADPRFQVLLRGGGPAPPSPDPSVLLAKSAATPRQARLLGRARQASGYPSGLRHELMSEALVRACPALLEGATDPDLVLHLVASHHGWCRPFPPLVPDGAPVHVEVDLDGHRASAPAADGPALARLDAGLADRFERLNERYGPWGLAWLEALLRLADHRASEEESR